MTRESTISDTNFMQRLEQLEQDNRRIGAENQQFRAQFQTAQRRLRITTGLAFAALTGVMVISPGSRSAIAQGYGVTLQQLANRLTAVESKDTQQDAALARLKERTDNLEQRAVTQEVKTHFLSADINGRTTTFSGCNVYVQNGLGATNGNPNMPGESNNSVVNGVGNLIIGYNVSQAQFGGTDVRTGSHNLILGDSNNYSSYGGLVAGAFNTISAPYATVTGGAFNTASFLDASVSGGAFNTAGGFTSSVSGGVNVTQNDAEAWSAGNLHSP